VSRLKTSLPESLATLVKATIADFGIVKPAQARGDFQVLADHGRRALRVHLGSNLKAGLGTLQAALQKAL
jgi:transaldolase/glucose-6-phosphate isomerase